MTEARREERDPQAPDNNPDEPGSEGGASSPATDALPGEPADDDSALGDTDQHPDA